MVAGLDLPLTLVGDGAFFFVSGAESWSPTPSRLTPVIHDPSSNSMPGNPGPEKCRDWVASDADVASKSGWLLTALSVAFVLLYNHTAGSF